MNNTEVKSSHCSDNYFEGSNYKRELTLKDIAKEVRIKLKEKYPDCKFSVRTEYYSMGQSLHLSVMEAPFEMYIRPEKIEEAINSRNRYYDERARKSYYERAISCQKEAHSQCNDKIFDEDNEDYKINNGHFITDKAYELLKDISNIVHSYNYDDSDIMTDYFSVNFYFHLSIGKWDNPFEIKGGKII